MPIMFIQEASPTTIEVYSGNSRNPNDLVLKAELPNLSLKNRQWKLTQCKNKDPNKKGAKDNPFGMEQGKITINIT